MTLRELLEKTDVEKIAIELSNSIKTEVVSL